MFNVNKAIFECDFCNAEINKIFRIFTPLTNLVTQCCYSCQQHRKNNGDIVKKGNKYYWR